MNLGQHALFCSIWTQTEGLFQLKKCTVSGLRRQFDMAPVWRVHGRPLPEHCNKSYGVGGRGKGWWGGKGCGSTEASSNIVTLFGARLVKRRTCYKPQNPEKLKYGKSRSKIGFLEIRKVGQKVGKKGSKIGFFSTKTYFYPFLPTF